ncbi:unnamed protein product, partial [Prunus brigantina]
FSTVDAEKWFGTFPRNLVIIFLRYALASVGHSIYLGRRAICLEFRCGTVAINCGTATSPPSSLARVLGRGLVITFGRLGAVLPFGVTSGENSLGICVRRESSVEAISGESFRYQKQFPTCANGKLGDFRCCE